LLFSKCVDITVSHNYPGTSPEAHDLCGDLLFSGHTIVFTLCICVCKTYLPKRLSFLEVRRGNSKQNHFKFSVTSVDRAAAVLHQHGAISCVSIALHCRRVDQLLADHVRVRRLPHHLRCATSCMLDDCFCFNTICINGVGTSTLHGRPYLRAGQDRTLFGGAHAARPSAQPMRVAHSVAV
jgi:hypothetical protein